MTFVCVAASISRIHGNCGILISGSTNLMISVGLVGRGRMSPNVTRNKVAVPGSDLPLSREVPEVQEQQARAGPFQLSQAPPFSVRA